MPTLTPTKTDLPGGNLAYAWSPLAAGDDGAPSNHSGTGDRTVQVFGNFGVGGEVTIEGSLDGTNWAGLRDPNGVALVFTSAGIKAVLENTTYTRPRVTGGDGSTALTTILNVRR
jgi:hypothetical protein